MRALQPSRPTFLLLLSAGCGPVRIMPFHSTSTTVLNVQLGNISDPRRLEFSLDFFVLMMQPSSNGAVEVLIHPWLRGITSDDTDT
ncbi:hypothetical protein B0T24DRAFT_165253 [Lasiosphaeria ovina]|uniref:Uncharacterized protein n=1 Tax=Lasiosphaeria ovina TaxID=92902 RepID=A0AAE0NDZ5_9PEZI|nr:hypothetical protein B0T24DRAFT_165253 [Lasiosphaeria ovina]